MMFETANDTGMTLLPSGILWSCEPVRFQQMAQAAAGRAVTEADRIAALARIRGRSAYELRDGIAVIPVTGLLEKTSRSIWSYWFGGTSYQQIIEGVRAALADDAVKGILLHVDSPGGTVDGLSDVGDALYAARSQKPVWAFIDGLAASAAFYLAAQSSWIIAGRTSVVGSIGTSAVIYDWSRFFDEAGVEAVHLKTGPLKNIGVMGTEITEDQRAHIQNLVNEFFADFITAVARGRGQSEERIREIADGRVVVVGSAGMPGGGLLYDAIGTFDETVAALKAQVQASRPAAPPRRTAAETFVEQLNAKIVAGMPRADAIRSSVIANPSGARAYEAAVAANAGAKREARMNEARARRERLAGRRN